MNKIKYYHIYRVYLKNLTFNWSNILSMIVQIVKTSFYVQRNKPWLGDSGSCESNKYYAAWLFVGLWFIHLLKCTTWWRSLKLKDLVSVDNTLQSYWIPAICPWKSQPQVSNCSSDLQTYGQHPVECWWYPSWWCWRKSWYWHGVCI